MVDMVPYVSKGKESTMKFSTVLACSAAVAFTFASSAFGEDAYIESDGSDGAGINTGFFVGPQTKIEIDFQLTTNSQNQVRFFGAKGTEKSDTDPECECYVGKNGSGTECFSFISGASGGTRQASNLKAIDTLRHRIVLDFYEAKEFQVWTGDSKTKKDLSDFPAHRQNYPLVFFCKNYTSYGTYSSYTTTLAYPAKMRVYRFRIWEAGVLVRDYTPFKKGGIAGFKENCSGRFVMGENIAAFTAGGDVEEGPDDPYITSEGRNLPGQSVSGSTIYIDTGYLFNPTTRIEFDYALMTNWATNNLYGSDSKNIFTGPSSNGYIVYLFMHGGAANVGYYYTKVGKAEGSASGIGLATAYGVRRSASVNSNKFHIITAGYTNHTRTASAEQAITTTLAGTLKLGTYLPMRIYGLKIYESDVLVKNYLPFVKNGVAGLTNSLDASDIKLSTTVGLTSPITAVYDAGGDITDDDYEKEAYVEFPGVAGQGVNTGHIVTKDTCIEMDFSCWNTTSTSEPFFFEQMGANGSVHARLFRRSNNYFSYRFEDLPSSNWTNVRALDNERYQFKFDAPKGCMTIQKNGEELYNESMPGSLTATTCSTNLWIGCNWAGLTHNAFMRLYNFKITEAGEVVRNYVPCVRNGQAGLYDLVNNTFSAVAGGKVRGATLAGQEFQISPQPATLTHQEGENTTTLTCLAAGAQRYEWYLNGEKEDIDSDSVTVTWTHKRPHVRTYSVVPVYTVFNETVKGTPITATVEMTPRGTVVKIR